MVATSLALLAASLGVLYSFEPADDGTGRYDYVVKVEPQLLDSLARGADMPIESHVPKHVSSIRTIRVVLGGGATNSASGPVERTSFKQVQGNWTASSNSAAAPTYGNYTTGNTGAAHVEPPRLLGAVQDAGSALVDNTRSGMQEVGQRLQNAGQHVTSAVDELSGGTLGRIGDAVRQPFNASNTGNSGTSAGPLQTVGTVARDFVNDTQQQFSNVGQAVRETTDRLVGSQNYKAQPTDYRAQPSDYRSQPADYRNQSSSSTMPPNPDNNRYVNAQNTDSSGLSDPGRNPFQTGTTGAPVTGPSFGNDYRNQAAANQTGNSSTTTSQSPFEARPQNSSQGNQFSNTAAQSDMVPVSSIDSWQYQQQTPDYRSDNSFSTGQATITSDRTDPWAHDPWSNRNVATQQPPAASVQAPPVSAGQYTPPQAGGAPFHQAGLNSPSDVSHQTQAPQEKPWAPLLGTGVALIGSLGANLFLGFSFLDARHKYLSAIRRGARSLGRADV